MNIQDIIEYLNKTKGYSIPAQYYTQIKIWRDWWKGYHEPFHQFKERGVGNEIINRKLFTLKMGKKVCEDWAAILLNEKTQIVIKDGLSSIFVQGDKDCQGAGGILGDNDFWHKGNELVEKAFYSGTGAIILKLSGMLLRGDTVMQSKDTKIYLDYLPAHHIIPLTARNGKIIEAAFVSEVLEKGQKYAYVETHELVGGQYRITNQYLKIQNEQVTEAPLPEGIAHMIHTGAGIPLFAIISPNIVNTFDNSNGLGMSIYAHSIDNLMGVDLAFNNFCRDFKLGGKKVFYTRDLLDRDADGNPLTPDDVMQQLFVSIGDDVLDENGYNKKVQEFNPDLRVRDNKEGIQAQLDYLSFKCGLGTKHYQFNAGSVVTATQYMGDKQELIQNAAKHYIAIERALQDVVKAILWAGKEILGQPVNPDAQVTVNFEDSYIIDKESERLRDLQEIRDGLMQKWEYRVKWKGEDENTAKKMVGAEITDDDLMGFGGDE